MKKHAVELAVALGVAALCVGGLVEASGYRGASAYMPTAVVGFALALSLVWAAQSTYVLVRGGDEPLGVSAATLSRFALLVAAAVLYVFGIRWLGFFTSSFVMVPGLAAALGYRRWPVLAASTLAFVAVLYAVFRLLLSVPLPPEAVLGLFGA